VGHWKNLQNRQSPREGLQTVQQPSFVIIIERESKRGMGPYSTGRTLRQENVAKLQKGSCGHNVSLKLHGGKKHPCWKEAAAPYLGGHRRASRGGLWGIVFQLMVETGKKGRTVAAEYKGRGQKFTHRISRSGPRLHWGLRLRHRGKKKSWRKKESWAGEGKGNG